MKRIGESLRWADLTISIIVKITAMSARMQIFCIIHWNACFKNRNMFSILLGVYILTIV